MRRQHWKFAAIGFLIGMLLLLPDLLFEWRGPKFLPWGSPGALGHNIGYFAGGGIVVGIVGFIVGLFIKRPA